MWSNKSEDFQEVYSGLSSGNTQYVQISVVSTLNKEICTTSQGIACLLTGLSRNTQIIVYDSICDSSADMDTNNDMSENVIYNTNVQMQAD